MPHNSSASRFLIISSFMVLLIFAAGCAEVRLNTIPAPPPSTKLRVFLQPVTGLRDQGKWMVPHEDWARMQVRTVRALLRETGMYEISTRKDVAAVTGGRTFSILDWSRKDWYLAREVGRALHADYAMVMERGFSKGSHELEMVMINVETGKRFKVLIFTRHDRSVTGDYMRHVNRLAYNELFREAKSDMLSTAIRKGRMASPEFFTAKAAVPPRSSAKPAPPPSTLAQSPAAEKSSATQEIRQKLDYDEVLSAGEKGKSGTNLAVYDLDTAEPYRVVALILSEALRQELFKLGLFQMVNRENIVKVLEELALQQTGLIDEKEAARAGRGLAAQQIVLGRYGILGKNSVVQVKRVDVESQGTLALGTLKCDVGREEDLLEHMTELAREIAKRQ